MTDFVEYLTAKRSVDDRALDRRVWDRFVSHLVDRARSSAEPVEVVEVGAGVGSMLARLASWESLPGRVSYRLVDVDETTVSAARERVPEWLADAGYETEWHDCGRLTATRDDEQSTATHDARADDASTEDVRTEFDVSFTVADAAALADGADGSASGADGSASGADGSGATVDGRASDDADAVVAAAFLDVVDLDRMLPALRELLRPAGVVYAPCTFDGGTQFSPPQDHDSRIERLYHRHMDEVRERPGGSRAGREVLERAPSHGFTVEAVGGCDWVVRPWDGTYPHAEATFLAHLLTTIDGALADYPNETLDPTVREAWVDTRRRQLDRGELILVAHHLDLLLRADADG
ncbi:hypothetical protein JCM18237_30130 [Halorubrum luteum]